MADVLNLLLVDDIEDNLLVLEALLAREGLTILKAKSGAEALELLLVHDVALALLDVQMPEMDGFELAELMRGSERTRHVPIIFVTAGARDPDRVFRGYESGAVDFLFKPIEPQVLMSKVDVFLELHRQRRELAQALKLNEMFVGILGHDLRNPVSAVLAGAQLLSRQITGEAQQRTLNRVIGSTRRMSEMIEQLLDLTRARLGGGLGFLRNRKPLDLRSVVERSVEELRGANPDRELRIEALGDAASTGDEGRLMQLFSNLIGNAVQHGTPGTPIIVKLDGTGPELKIAVKNQGAIPSGAMKTLFDPFRDRSDRAGASKKGLGLGLYISQQIALAHGGKIEVESSPEAGTAFTVKLPRKVAEAQAAKPVSKAKTVLIVEDDENLRDSLREAFEDDGYQAISVSNGKEALELLQTTDPRPDVVVLDLVLPLVDGWKVCEVMRADAELSKIPIVVSTANPAGAPSGVIVVSKPHKLKNLLGTVARIWA